MSRNPLTFLRGELYELVWSKPMTEVAKELGMTDRGVAKRCKEVQVPVPGRGYWARLAAGQHPKKPPLLKYRAGSEPTTRPKGGSSRIAVEVESSVLPTPKAEKPPLPFEMDRHEPAVTFYRPRSPEPSAELRDEAKTVPDPREVALERILAGLPAPADAQEEWLLLEDPSFTPPGWPESLRTPARLPPITVHSKAALHRARRLATNVIQVIGQIGWRFNQKVEEPEVRGYYNRYENREETERRAAHFLVEGERLFISITERQSRTERPLTPEEAKERKKDPRMFYYRDRYQYSPTGELTLYVSTSSGSGGFVSYRDSNRGPLEARISAIVRSLLKGALDIKKDRQEALEAEERRQAEEARQERIRANREAHRKLIAQLEAEAGAWERAQRLRRYLKAVQGMLPAGGRLEVPLEDKSVNLLEIGAAFANQLDPLHPAPRTGAYFAKNDPYATGKTYESDDSSIKKFVSRLLGAGWPGTAKRFAVENATKPVPPSHAQLLGLTPDEQGEFQAPEAAPFHVDAQE